MTPGAGIDANDSVLIHLGPGVPLLGSGFGRLHCPVPSHEDPIVDGLGVEVSLQGVGVGWHDFRQVGMLQGFLTGVSDAFGIAKRWHDGN